MLKDKPQQCLPTEKQADGTTKASVAEEVQLNPFTEMYRAVKRAILTIRENPQDKNTLNNQNPERECDAFYVFQLLNVAIQDAKNYEPALNERCNLLYFDMPTTTNMLQAYWVDYEVWFRETSAWKYRDWVERYLVMLPFTDHSDARSMTRTDTETTGNPQTGK